MSSKESSGKLSLQYDVSPHFEEGRKEGRKKERDMSESTETPALPHTKLLVVHLKD